MTSPILQLLIAENFFQEPEIEPIEICEIQQGA